MQSHSIFLAMIFLITSMVIVPSHAASQNANALVSGILSYTTWNPNIAQLNFCIIDGPAKFISSHIFNPPSPLIKPNDIKIEMLSSPEILTTPEIVYRNECNVLYFVDTVDQIQQRILNYKYDGILTISEQNPECAIGSTFCLYRHADKYSFKVNLVSLKKSNIRVNSKVLMLANAEEGK